ncbi:hypothetical protein SAY86_016451 [Trapa natans]|uniref:Protein kinase domain-containing protein n=1 Tax=Trapa natans TaxID=22666 RepID=A0AAN7LD76_TRANT|nr:hypothetical protein SAY86_016451 [Trapa natans]
MPSATPRDLNPLLLLLRHSLPLLLLSTLVDSLDLQGQALLSWKTSTLNNSVEVFSSWSPLDSTPCGWLGIRCDSDGAVVEVTVKEAHLKGPVPLNFLQPLKKSLQSLIISSVNLTGAIPALLADYSQLVTINLSDNALTGEIPSAICMLKNLRRLSLNINSLSGEIPSCIGNLSSLEHLALYDNQLEGKIPWSIGELRNLQVFRAGGNRNIAGELPEEIGNCSSLIMLGLAETSVSGGLPSSIGKLKRIQTIAIYTSVLSGNIPAEIGNCSELQNLYLYQNSLTGPIPFGVGKLGKLQALLLWQNSLSGSIPDELGSCTEMKIIDLSENLLAGPIPGSFGNLLNLQELLLSVNQLSGTIPVEIANCRALTHLVVDNNGISGNIPAAIGDLKNLTIFFAWRNGLTGKVPESLSNCEELQALDLSYNNLTGPIPGRIFGLRNLTKLMLLSNNLSGFIPPDVGNCTALYRLRLNKNNLGGTVPLEIGSLESLNFLDLSENQFIGNIPLSISGCRSLEFIDLHSNGLTGRIPSKLPRSLQFVDLSENSLTGELPPDIGAMTELIKLSLSKNRLSGRIPGEEIAACTRLQMLDLGGNEFSGEIPGQIGLIPSLGISVNLSFNKFSGAIPAEFSKLTKLAVLDLSHNELSDNLDSLASLVNLVSLNISFNNFSGEVPDTPFFRSLPLSDLQPNNGLHFPRGPVGSVNNHIAGLNVPARSTGKVVMLALVSSAVIITLPAIYMLVRAWARGSFVSGDNLKSNINHWEMTLYQKIVGIAINDILESLTSSSVIGTGSSGIVYRVTLANGESLAVKRMWSSDESSRSFRSEIETLGSIRHKNIVRLLGWASNRHTNLLFYDYLPNGSLSSVLHGATRKGGTDWDLRFHIVIGVAYALAYLHHDCAPPILHGDVKAMNVLLGAQFETYLADFGLARKVHLARDDDPSMPSPQSRLGGSYGYMAPEYASMQPITEKSDVYSFGVVLMEALTGRHPLDPTLPGGAHLVQWVRDHLSSRRDPVILLDPNLRGMADPGMHEMVQTLAVSLLCVSTRANDRPMMKDVAAMLTEIRHTETTKADPGVQKEGLLARGSSLVMKGNAASQGSPNCSFIFSDDSV